jgi:hypothetical protein
MNRLPQSQSTFLGFGFGIFGESGDFGAGTCGLKSGLIFVSLVVLDGGEGRARQTNGQ